MTRIVVTLLCLLGLVAASPTSAPSSDPSGPSTDPVTADTYRDLPRVGEEFTYAVDYGGVVGAYIKVKVGQGPSHAPGSRVLTAYLATTPLVQQVWRIRDKLMALYLPAEGRTVATRLWEDENGKRMFREEKFHDQQIKVTEKRPGTERAFAVDSQPPLLDAFSALFELRRRPLRPDSSEKARIYLNRKIYDCDAQVHSDEIEYRGQTIRTLRVDPVLTHAGQAVDGVGFTFWLSDDAERRPLRIEADVRYGKLAGTLVPPATATGGPSAKPDTAR